MYMHENEISVISSITHWEQKYLFEINLNGWFEISSIKDDFIKFISNDRYRAWGGKYNEIINLSVTVFSHSNEHSQNIHLEYLKTVKFDEFN